MAHLQLKPSVEMLRFWSCSLLFLLQIKFCSFVLFFQEGLGLQCSCLRAQDISKGVIKGWWAETPHLPLYWINREGVNLLFCRLMYLKRTKNNPPLTIKARISIFTLVNLRNQHCNDLHLLPDLPKHTRWERF